MPNFITWSLKCLIICLAWIAYMQVVHGFSDGMKLTQGSSAARKIYCNRPPSRRGPLHFHKNCNGFCEPRPDFDNYYVLNVSSSTYWLGIVRVNITAKIESGKSLTGFSIYALDDNEFVAGSFEDSDDVVVGTCNDVISITDETHGAFHKIANHQRKNISVVWQPDGYNHERVRFVIWVVNNHSDVYHTESQWLTSEKNGHDPLDVATDLKKIMSTVDMESFEKSFRYRSTKGYQLNLTDPFSAFAKSPSLSELIQVDNSHTSKDVSMQSLTPSSLHFPDNSTFSIQTFNSKTNKSNILTKSNSIDNSIDNNNNNNITMITQKDENSVANNDEKWQAINNGNVIAAEIGNSKSISGDKGMNGNAAERNTATTQFPNLQTTNTKNIDNLDLAKEIATTSTTIVSAEITTVGSTLLAKEGTTAGPTLLTADSEYPSTTSLYVNFNSIDDSFAKNAMESSTTGSFTLTSERSVTSMADVTSGSVFADDKRMTANSGPLGLGNSENAFT